MVRRLLLLALGLLAVLPLGGRTLAVGNEEFRSALVFRGHRFEAATWNDLRAGRELTAGEQAPLFEFCIDGQVVTSSDPVWAYAGLSRRSLPNGGVVTSFVFRGRGAWKGLRLVWDREVFPSGAFVRERLRLTCDGARTFRLTCQDGRNHFVFPCYSFASAGPVQAKELRIGTFRRKRAFPEHHRFHPDSSRFAVGAAPQEVKGPFLVLSGPAFRAVTSYEHASQDNTFAQAGRQAASAGNDGDQGVVGSGRALSDDDLWFIGSFASLADGRLVFGDRIRHGGYLDGETIPSGGRVSEEGPRSGWYETVWSMLAVLPPDGDAEEAIADYLMNRITDNAAAREADFYYNTWGMQRARPRTCIR